MFERMDKGQNSLAAVFDEMTSRYLQEDLFLVVVGVHALDSKSSF